MEYSEEDIDDAADIAEFREVMGNLHGQIFDDMQDEEEEDEEQDEENGPQRHHHHHHTGFQSEEEVERIHCVMEVNFLYLHYLLEKVFNLEVVFLVMTIAVIFLIDHVSCSSSRANVTCSWNA